LWRDIEGTVLKIWSSKLWTLALELSQDQVICRSVMFAGT